jgi:chorismate mutase
MALLTDVRVEQMVVERVRLKAATFGQDINPQAATGAAAGGDGSAGSSSSSSRQYKIQPDVLAAMYDTIVMPLTKDVQVEYLLHRLDHEEEV